jgi:hypothetical protein
LADVEVVSTESQEPYYYPISFERVSAAKIERVSAAMHANHSLAYHDSGGNIKFENPTCAVCIRPQCTPDNQFPSTSTFQCCVVKWPSNSELYWTKDYIFASAICLSSTGVLIVIAMLCHYDMKIFRNNANKIY